MTALSVSYPVTVRKLAWREVSGVLQSARGLGLGYHIETLPREGRGPRYYTTVSGVVLYRGDDLVDARAAADRHFARAVAEVLE